MAELKRPVCSNTSCPMVLHGTCTVGRNEAGCNYEVSTNTPAAKNAANVFLDNSIALVFDKPMPKLLAVVTDKADEKQVFLGSTVRVDAIFSHEIEYKRGTFKIEVSAPENVESVNSLMLVDRHTIRNNFKVIKTGEVTFTVTYTDEKGTESTANVAITVINVEDYVAPAPEVVRVVVDKAEVKVEDTVTVQVRTDRPLKASSEVTITVDDKFTKEGEAVLLADKKTVKQVLKAAKEGETEVQAQVAAGKVVKKVAVKVNTNPKPEPPVEDPKIQSVSVNPQSVEVGKDAVVTITFDKAPELGSLVITPDSEKLTEKVKPAVSGNDVTVTYTGKAVGVAKVSAKYKEQEAKETTVTVTQPAPTKAVFKSITAAPTSQQVGKDVTVTLAFDKAPVLGEVTITPDAAHLTVKNPKAISGNNVTVTYTVKGTPGSAKVTAVHNGVTKECTVTVTA